MSSAVTIRSVTGGPDLGHVRTLLREYNDHLVTTIDAALLRHRETELAALPANFLPPSGALLLASSGDHPLACAGLRRALLSRNTDLDAARTAEFCRLWVTPAARGQKLGARLLNHAIHLARQAAYTTLVLNSVPETMGAAQVLYQRAGFQPTAPYKHVPIPGIAFFQLQLTTP